MTDKTQKISLDALVQATLEMRDATKSIISLNEYIQRLEDDLSCVKKQLATCKTRFTETVLVWENAVGEFKTVLTDHANVGFAHSPHTSQDAAVAPGEALMAVEPPLDGLMAADAVPFDAPAPGNELFAPSDPDSNAPFQPAPQYVPDVDEPPFYGVVRPSKEWLAKREPKTGW